MYTVYKPSVSPFKTGYLGDMNLIVLVLIKGPDYVILLP